MRKCLTSVEELSCGSENSGTVVTRYTWDGEDDCGDDDCGDDDCGDDENDDCGDGDDDNGSERVRRR